MDSLKTLKQLKRIHPDPDYTKRSRSLIVETPYISAPPVSNPWRALVQSLQFGTTMVLVGVFLILVVGGFSSWKFLSPFKTASLDPAALQAEAQAVTSQLELAKITYTENQPSAPSAPAAESARKQAARRALEQAEKMGLVPVNSSNTLTIDGSLDRLSE